ncbi:Spartin-like [Oopsacas minuta]|uniref:Spartin-like n=1 Tax=Oopsacas minuta TaxID=111878 RepID=A0AAV7K269_9METZ|nr:Spartin-like [Oopsacas minuta]
MTTQLSKNDTSTVAKNYYKQGYSLVKEALSSDERRDLPQAYQLYIQAKRILNKALSLSTQRDEIAKIKELLHKVEIRIKDFESKLNANPIPAANYSDNPPSYTDCMSDRSPAPNKGNSPQSMRILLSLDNVTIYQVQRDGDTISHKPNTLYLCEYVQRIKGQPPAFLGCGPWVTPIVPNKTIVYRPTSYLYMFPDSMTYFEDCDVSETFTGLVLDTTMSDKERNRFQYSIESLCIVKEGALHTPEPAPSIQEEGDNKSDTQQGWGELISEKLTSGSSYISSMIGRGETKGEQLIEKGGDKIRDSIQPNPEDTNIHPAIETSLYVGKKVTGAAVTVGDFMLTNLAKLTWTAGEHVYSYISSNEQLKNYSDNHHAEQAMALTKSTAKSGGVIYISASDAAKKLLSTSSNEVVNTVEHKYGESAGNVTDKSMRISVDAIDLISYFNWKSLAVKFGAKTLSEGANRYQDPPPQVPTVEKN